MAGESLKPKSLSSWFTFQPKTIGKQCDYSKNAPIMEGIGTSLGTYWGDSLDQGWKQRGLVGTYFKSVQVRHSNPSFCETRSKCPVGQSLPLLYMPSTGQRPHCNIGTMQSGMFKIHTKQASMYFQLFPLKQVMRRKMCSEQKNGLHGLELPFLPHACPSSSKGKKMVQQRGAA